MTGTPLSSLALPTRSLATRQMGKAGSMRVSVHRLAGIALALVAAQSAPSWARGQGQAPPYVPPLIRPAGASGTVVVPDRFLRRWDPVTVFFARDVGPEKGGAEDHPERFVSANPPHPGAFTWIDARTLQFHPAVPWPPLARFSWTVEGATSRLATLMEPPIATIPANNADGIEAVEAISLSFAEPLDEESLLRMATIELRPLPGIGPEGSRWLKSDDFTLKVIERTGNSDAATYVLNLASPIPLGTRAIVHLRLSLEDDPTLSFSEVTFSTAEPFRVISFGCDAVQVPATPEGSRWAREQALRCDPNNRRLLVRFSSPPSGFGPIEARNLVRLTPGVDNLSYGTGANYLTVTGNFAAETLYRVTLAPTPLKDSSGRSLDMRGESEVYVAFPRKGAYLNLGASSGILERFGSQMVPLGGRGDERVDLRIQRRGERSTAWLGYGLSWYWAGSDLSGTSSDFTGRQLLTSGVSGTLGSRFGAEVQVAYGAGLPYTSVPFRADSPAEAARTVGTTQGQLNQSPPLTGGLDEDFLRVDLEVHATFRPRWGRHQWEVQPYLRVLNALDRRDALFYAFQPWRGDGVTPLAERPLVPVLGVAWRF